MWVFICAVYAANTVGACVAEALAEFPVLMRWTAPLQRHRNVPIHDSDSLTASPILAFAERQLLANNGHWRASLECPVYTPKRTSNRIKSGFRGKFGGKPAANYEIDPELSR